MLIDHFPQFLDGFLVTLGLIAVSFVIAAIVGTFVAALRVQPIVPLSGSAPSTSSSSATSHYWYCCSSPSPGSGGRA